MALGILQLPWKTIVKEALYRTMPVTNLLCFIHVTNTYFCTPAFVIGPSMLPTFSLTGDLVLAKRFGRVGHGDIVLVRSPENPRKIITKRVTAVEGETVSYLVDPYGSEKCETIVPKGHVWIQGDNVIIGKLDSLNHPKGSNALGLAGDSKDGAHAADRQSTLSCQDKRATVHAEMERVNKLPSNSSYATHRMRVLNKLLHLMNIQRTRSQDEELELLFAGLSL